jgi:hypothetical protein
MHQKLYETVNYGPWLRASEGPDFGDWRRHQHKPKLPTNGTLVPT